MAVWGLVFLAAFAGVTVNGDDLFSYPELVRGDSRIVSGWEADLGQIPHQLSLRMVSNAGAVSSCGATVIHPDWGLTAAHCTAGRVSFVIRAGTVNLTRPLYIFETTEVFNHPEFNEATPSVVQPHDISLLKFGRSLDLNEYVQPIRLQRSSTLNQNYDGVRMIASGWGRTWTDGASPENLNWVYLRGTSNIECFAAYWGSSIIQDSTICARGYNVTSQSTCQGDSGGPLVIEDDDGKLSQVGVTSFVSATGCHTDFPAGFIRPGHYHDWFKQVTDIDFDWELENIATEKPETTESGESSSEEDEDEDPEAVHFVNA